MVYYAVKSNRNLWYNLDWYNRQRVEVCFIQAKLYPETPGGKIGAYALARITRGRVVKLVITEVETLETHASAPKQE